MNGCIQKMVLYTVSCQYQSVQGRHTRGPYYGVTQFMFNSHVFKLLKCSVNFDILVFHDSFSIEL
jgi:hypothetical protein